MGGEHCHNSTIARFSYLGRAVCGALSLQLRNSTFDQNILLQTWYSHYYYDSL